MPDLRDRVALTTAYAAGLWVGEVSRLKPVSIDSKRVLISVIGAKVNKDRYVMLSPRLLEILTADWHEARPRQWLFLGRNVEDPVSIGTLQEACRKARKLRGSASRQRRTCCVTALPSISTRTAPIFE